MKKILSIAFAGAALMSLVACSDASYDDKYADPSKTSTVGVPQVFTAIQDAGNTWMNPVYYRYYTQSTTSGTFSGIIGTDNSRGRWRGASEGYFNTRWQNFYNMLTQYRLLEKTYNDLPEAQQAANQIFVYLGRTMVEAQLHEMMSLWGDVPFTGAGTLWATSDYDASKTADVYDDDVESYKIILSDLKVVGDYLAGDVNSTGLASLKRQDISLAAGDKEMWQRYVNSLRLRIALHLATNGDLTSEAKSAIKEILENPTKYPVIETNAQNQGVAGDTQTDKFNYGKSFSQALHTGGYAVVSNDVLEAMGINDDGTVSETSDPRVASMLDPNPDNTYVSYDITKSSTENSNTADTKNQEYVKRGINSCNYWVQVDSVALQGRAQYDGNSNLNGLWMGAAEVALSTAECYFMGYGVSKDVTKAGDYFVKGVALSTEYYGQLKTNSSLYTPGYDDISGTSRTYEPVDYEDGAGYGIYLWGISQSQEMICGQEWLNHFVMNELEAWNVVRRTGFPTIEIAADALTSDYPTPPFRLPYTSDEKNYNSANEAAAEAKNYTESTGYYTKLFWAKDGAYYKQVASK